MDGGARGGKHKTGQPSAVRDTQKELRAMANLEHLQILKQGVEAWNVWRRQHREIAPNLTSANLSKAHLTNANLSDANLLWANLSRAN